MDRVPPAPSQADLSDFYEEGYSGAGEDALRYQDWRALSARGKAERTLKGLGRQPRDGVSLLEVGCGDGSLLAELRVRRPGWSYSGAEIADAPTRIARDRNPEADIRRYDGEHLPWPVGAFDVGVLSHVLEHVIDPPATLREIARVCRTVVVEVPLEANLSAARSFKRHGSDALGHLHHFSRADVRRAVREAALAPVRELTDPLPRDVHRFFAGTPIRRMAADARWAVRGSMHRLSARVAERVFTVHYLVVCESAQDVRLRR